MQRHIARGDINDGIFEFGAGLGGHFVLQDYATGVSHAWYFGLRPLTMSKNAL